MSTEPLLTVSGITALITALIAFAVAFGVPLSPEQQAALLGVVAVVAPLVVGAVARGKVTPTDSHDPTLRR